MPRPILLVEDDPRDLELVREALARAVPSCPVDVARDGEEALDYLHRRGPFAGRPPGLPAVALVDLRMPRLCGLDVLARVKADPGLKVVPVVVLTSSREEADLVRSYDLGANAYVVKPAAVDEFAGTVRQLGRFWAARNVAASGYSGGA